MFKGILIQFNIKNTILNFELWSLINYTFGNIVLHELPYRYLMIAVKFAITKPSPICYYMYKALHVAACRTFVLSYCII